jgi:hypothetical protein
MPIGKPNNGVAKRANQQPHDDRNEDEVYTTLIKAIDALRTEYIRERGEGEGGCLPQR